MTPRAVALIIHKTSQSQTLPSYFTFPFLFFSLPSEFSRLPPPPLFLLRSRKDSTLQSWRKKAMDATASIPRKSLTTTAAQKLAAAVPLPSTNFPTTWKISQNSPVNVSVGSVGRPHGASGTHSAAPAPAAPQLLFSYPVRQGAFSLFVFVFSLRIFWISFFLPSVKIPFFLDMFR